MKPNAAFLDVKKSGRKEPPGAMPLDPRRQSTQPQNPLAATTLADFIGPHPPTPPFYQKD